MMKDNTATKIFKNPADFIPIAVIGAGAIFAQAANPHQYWKNIIEKKDLITDIPDSHWLITDYFEPDPKKANQQDKIYTKRGSFIDPVEFDPIEFGTPPNILPAIDTAQLLALITAKQVLGDLKNNTLNLERTSVILGASVLEAVQYLSARTQRPVWAKALQEIGLSEKLIQQACDKIAQAYPQWQEDSFPGLLSNVIAGRIANRFNLGGTNCTTDAACASSLAAVSMAVNELQAGTADMVITGGVDALNDILMYKCFSIVGALSPSDHCRSFSDKADGTLLGEGIGLFALKRLSDAVSDQNNIYGVIRGIGTSSDGRAKSIYAPVSEGQSRAVSRAYERAGYEINTVGLIEAHGTGTVAGDLAEINGLLSAFKNSKIPARPQSCAVGSVKSQIGHTKSAAGAAGLLKALFALRHKILPATLHVDKLNPRFDLKNSAVYINTQTRPWIQNNLHPRRAGVSCFGFGGSNFHLTLEEYIDKNNKNLAPKFRVLASELIIFCAPSQEDLLSQINLYTQPDYLLHGLAYIAHETQVNFTQKIQNKNNNNNTYKLMIIAENIKDLEKKLNYFKNNINNTDIFYSTENTPNISPKLAFCFPGQGSQYINMGKDLLMNFDQAMSVWETFSPENLAEIVYPVPVFNPEDEKNQQHRLQETQWAQPALALASLSQLALLETVGVNPDALIGHSFGEITALYAAGAMDAKSFMQIAVERGRLMQAKTHPAGAMLAVKTSSEILSTVLAEITDKKISQQITIANDNSPSQQVLSGELNAIESIQKILMLKNISCIRLNVSGAFHSPLMADIEKSFLETLKKQNFYALNKPVYSNLTAEKYDSTSPEIPVNLSRQLTHPVKFCQSIQKMHADGINIFVEAGPHQVLSNLIKQCLPEHHDCHIISLDNPQVNGVTQFWRGLAQLICLGYSPDLLGLWKDYLPLTSEKPPEKKAHTVQINGTNYQKPYPDLTPSNTPKNPAAHFTSLLKPAVLFTEKPTMPPETTFSQELQKQLVDVHNNHQNALLQSHLEFLKTFAQLNGQPGSPINSPINSNSNSNINTNINKSLSAQTSPQISPAAAPPPAPVNIMPVFTPPLITPKLSPTPAFQPLSQQTAQQLVMEIVVEKTGYPLEMLNTNMDIEADLGIDSIKRVEILSSLREKNPDLPEIAAADLSALKTLQDMIDYMEKNEKNEKKKPLTALS